MTPAEYPNVPWWPPKPGDKLRHFTLHGGEGNRRVKQVPGLEVNDARWLP